MSTFDVRIGFWAGEAIPDPGKETQGRNLIYSEMDRFICGRNHNT